MFCVSGGGRYIVKVLHVITGLNVGGAETMLARLLEQTDGIPGASAEVLSLLPPGPAADRIIPLGVPVHHLGMRAGRPSLTAAFKLAATVRRLRPDLIMGWMHHGQIAATLAALVTPGRPPVIWNVRHSLSGFVQEKPLTRLLLRLGALLSRTPKAIIYNSRTAAAQYGALGFDGRRAVVIPNGFHVPAASAPAIGRAFIQQRLGIGIEPLLIAMVARDHPMKDVPNLVIAFSRLIAAGLDAHLLLVGQNMDRPTAAVAALLARIPSARWTLAGHRSDVAGWLGGVDVLALPSAWGEGFPNIVGEAMAAGVACVATDVGDSGWLVAENGRVVPPADAEALADALLDLHRLGPAGRRKLGMAARERIARDFALPDIARRYLDLCRAVTAPRQERAAAPTGIPRREVS